MRLTKDDLASIASCLEMLKDNEAPEWLIKLSAKVDAILQERAN